MHNLQTMKIIFNVKYNTVFGEELLLNIVTRDLSRQKKVTSFHMQTHDGVCWKYEMMCSGAVADEINYYYSVDAEGLELRHEWEVRPHCLSLSARKGNEYIVNDAWIDMPEDSYQYSSAFTKCIFKRPLGKVYPSGFDKTIRLKVRCPQLHADQRLEVVGENLSLGAWSPARGVPMTEHVPHEWIADLNAEELKNQVIVFKFVAVSGSNSQNYMWETNENRVLGPFNLKSGEVFVFELSQSFMPLSNVRLAGTLIPVFSLRSETSFGIGDFGDLKLMVDYVEKAHQHVLQLLPVNDTTKTHTWKDSYPYSCISVFALHPQYIDLRQLPKLKDEQAQKRYESLGKELNSLAQVDYERVNKAKNDYLQELFLQEKSAVLSSPAFKSFFRETGFWLVPYAQYCSLREKYGTADISLWEDHRVWNEKDRKALSNPRTKAYKEVAFYYFQQFILDRQLRSVHEYARSRQVILKGDIPIGVSPDSCDVWMQPCYFNLDSQAGAPPDDFSQNGQNWGFPTYNWDEMMKDDCRWWVRRFRNMAKYFDAYRIDHVIGFFRIWDIPASAVHALTGQFSPALGMTRSEIEAYGLNFQEDFFTKPFIADWVLDRIFGNLADEVRTVYLEKEHDDIYRLKPDFDTERKIEKAFYDKNSDKDNLLRNGLYALVNNVLFVRDRKDPDKFHPRISAQFNFTYEALWDSDKQLFNRIYDDYFYHRNNRFWYREAMKKLPLLVQATHMLVCAEDLGMVPDCVPWVMNELKILSLEIQTMPKDPHLRFGNLNENPYRSVATISTHDMPTMRQWWEENPGKTQDYYNNAIGRGGNAPHPLPGSVAKDIIFQHLQSPSMLCIVSLQDWMAMEESLRLDNPDAERINIPANPNHYWRYRMHVNIEDLMGNDRFLHQIVELIRQSGRYE